MKKIFYIFCYIFGITAIILKMMGLLKWYQSDALTIACLSIVGSFYIISGIRPKMIIARAPGFNHGDSIQEIKKKTILWTNRYFVTTTGGVTLDVVKQYIENQKKV